jgi:hypothetical protein
MTTLPPELLLHILSTHHLSAYASSLAYTPQSRIPVDRPEEPFQALSGYQHSLTSFSLVSKEWLLVARTLLYHSPVLTSWRQLSSFYHTIQTKSELLILMKGLIICNHDIAGELLRPPGHLAADPNEDAQELAQDHWTVFENIILLCANSLKILQFWEKPRKGLMRPLTLFDRRIQPLTLRNTLNKSKLRSLSLHGTSLLFATAQQQGPPRPVFGWSLAVLEELSFRDMSLPSGFQLLPESFPNLRKIRFMHCHRPGKMSLIPRSEHCADIVHLEFAYTILEDLAISETVRMHSTTIEYLAMVGKAELRAFATLIASEDSLSQEQYADRYVGPAFAVHGASEFPQLRQLVISLLATPEARHYDFALNAWRLPPLLKRLVIARRRWNEWRNSDFCDIDLDGVFSAVQRLLQDPEHAAYLKSVVMEGTFVSSNPLIQTELAICENMLMLCSKYNVEFTMTGRTIAEMLSAQVADPSWEMNRLM